MYVSKYTAAAAAAVSALPNSFAQVATSCQPLNMSCPNDQGLSTNFYFVDFTTVNSLPSDWSIANYETVNFGVNGAELTFAKRFDAPLIRSNFHFFFGSIEYIVQGAPGKGIVSSMVLLSDDLDEIDWEMTGTGGNQIETNYYGKGYPNYAVAQYVNVAKPQTQFHTYRLDWSAASLVWSIDNVVVRTLTPTEAGNYFPQTPMRVSLSLWDGGDPGEAPGTMNWAGGETPIPPPENYTMFVKSVKIKNAMPAKQYQYTDRTGSWQSIKIINITQPLPSSSSLSTIPSMGSSGNPIFSSNAPPPFPIAQSTLPFTSSVNSLSSMLPSASVLNTKATAAFTSLPSQLIQGSITTQIVYTTLTSCPVTKTITSNGTPTVQVATIVSTILSTLISPICNRCIAPVHTSIFAPSDVPIPSSLPASSLVSIPLTTSTLTPLPPPQTTQGNDTSKVAYTALTTCSVTTTITPPNGQPIQRVTVSISTILVTSPSAICTKCIVPVASSPPGSTAATTLPLSATPANPPIKALTAFSADAAVEPHLYEWSSELGIVASATSASPKAPVPAVKISYIPSYVTKVGTAIGSSSNSLSTAIMPADIFTPILETSSARASSPGESAALVSGILTSSITLSQTSTLTSYGVNPTANGNSSINSTIPKVTPLHFQDAASTNSSPTKLVALIMAVLVGLAFL